MKILLRNLKSGVLSLREVPQPQLEAQGVVVQNYYSLISAGTERAQVQMDKRSLIGKARARPDLVRQVLQKIRSEGIMSTLKAVQTRLGTPTPLGYSCAGVVLEAGEMTPGLRTGDYVACSGGGYANHAEVVYVPMNLAVPVPKNLDMRIAASAGVGAIALQGVRQSGAKLGETVAVIGLGLIGRLTCQLLQASGCRVVGIETDPQSLWHTQEHSRGILLMDPGCGSAAEQIHDLTGGLGVDATIICAATKESGPINLSAEISREQGTVSAVGLINLDLPREAFFKKELKLVVSRSLGPGRYDPSYEEHGLDYPAAYVRWTEGRNMEAYLQLAADGAIDPSALFTHEFEFEHALDAYKLISSKQEDYYLGVLLRYDPAKRHIREPILIKSDKPRPGKTKPGISIIGTGSYATKFLLPYVKEARLRGAASGLGASADIVGKRFGFEFAAAEHDQILKDPETDVVIIATRHQHHGSLTVRALQEGKAVFVEKPLCLTMDELRSIFAAHGEDGFLHVGFNRRFAPVVRAISEHFPTDSPAAMLCRINAGALVDHWLKDIATGGGRVLGEACHYIDLLRFLAGSPMTRIYATAVRKPAVSAIESEDISIAIEYKNGSIGTVLYTGSGAKSQTKERYEIFSAGRSAVIDDFRTLELYGGKRKVIRFRGRDLGQAEQMHRFLKGLNAGLPPIPFSELVESTLAAFAVIESITRAAPVEMGEMWALLEGKQ
jgi:predicted dehydrogenase/threonine dehydrogenase-like Zn-dependent dehydrogenase